MKKYVVILTVCLLGGTTLLMGRANEPASTGYSIEVVVEDMGNVTNILSVQGLKIETERRVEISFK